MQPKDSAIRRWLEGVGAVFLTGTTGFVGALLLEKLLRSAPNLAKVYVLIRDKKGQSAEQRFHKLIEDPVFRSVPSSQFKKVVVINGDASLPSLGLSDESWSLLQNDISLVFHAAANVKFDPHIRDAVLSNVRSTKEVLRLCQDAPKLKAIVYVSTAYSNSHLRYIDERVYTPPCSADCALSLVDSYDMDTLSAITPGLLGDWPNTYTYTKAIAEGLVSEAASHLPIVIVRPAIISSTAEEPFAGWTNSVNGPTGLFIGIGLGVIRVWHSPPLEEAMEAVPCDKVVNAILASAWDLDKRRSMGDINLKIFNVVASKENPLSWKLVVEATKRHGPCIVPLKTLWAVITFAAGNNFIFGLLDFLLHIIPAVLIDILAVLAGKKPRMLKIARMIQKHTRSYSKFCMTHWTFIDKNVTSLWKDMSTPDKEYYNFSLKDVDMDSYMYSMFIGARTYILKEPIDNIPAAIRRMRRLYWANAALFTVMWLLLLGVCSMLSSTVMAVVSPTTVVVSCILVFATVLVLTVQNPMYFLPPLPFS